MSEAERQLLVLTGILVLGIGAQWIAWRIAAPAILCLLGAGFIAGPLTGFLQPDEQFGKLLLPGVSLSVGLILFEGGLSLEFRELRVIGRPLFGLLTVGVVVTWALTTLAAHQILGVPTPAALLLAAILVVTGPTVIGPLLRDIRPVGRVGPIAKWEGIVIDPIGALLAVLVFEAAGAIGTDGYGNVFASAAMRLGLTSVIGLACGGTAALILTLVLRRFWIPDHLQNPATLMMVLAAFTTAEMLHSEAGLIAATVMGIGMANQRRVDIRRIVEFKESLTILLVSSLFIVLGARVSPGSLTSLGWRGLLFVACLMLVIRPAAVWLSTIGAGLSRHERLFLAWFAPRGIVAASVASVFAIRMGESGNVIASATLIVVFITVAVYGLSAGPLARRLKLAVANPEGLLIAGANRFARTLGSALQEAGFRVILIDTRYDRIRKAHALGLTALYGDIFSDRVVDRIDLSGLGRFLALTDNDDVNTLSATIFRDVFGSAHVYQLARSLQQDSTHAAQLPHLGGRTLFAADLLYERLDEAIDDGGVVKITPLTAEFDLAAFGQHYGSRAWPLFVIEGGHLRAVTLDAPCAALPGQSVVSLILSACEDTSASASAGPTREQAATNRA